MSYQAPPPQPGAGYQYSGPRPTSSKATVSLVLGILGLVLCGLLLGIPAMIVARQAKREIRDSQGQLDGDGLATAGFVTGLIGTVWSLLAVGVVVAVFIFGSTVASSFEESCTTVSDENGTSVECN